MTAPHDDRDLTPLLHRLQRLEDLEAARSHLHTYAAALDAPVVPERVAELFTADGTLTVPSGTWTGRDGVAAFYRDRTATDPSDKRHFIMSPQLTWRAPGTVEVEAYFLFTARGEERSALGWGLYRDVVRVVDGAPLFAAKTILPHHFTDLATGWAADR